MAVIKLPLAASFSACCHFRLDKLSCPRRQPTTRAYVVAPAIFLMASMFQSEILSGDLGE